VAAALAMAILPGCNSEVRRKSAAELGLNSAQARGRRVYDQRCVMCHQAYSSKSLNGPAMNGIFRRRELPSGRPVNDERVREVIVLGRSKMPGFGNVLTEQQVDELLAYLHTL